MGISRPSKGEDFNNVASEVVRFLLESCRDLAGYTKKVSIRGREGAEVRKEIGDIKVYLTWVAAGVDSAILLPQTLV